MCYQPIHDIDTSPSTELIAQKDSQIGELTRKLESTQRQLTTLQHQMEQMLRRLYGRKSEQLNPNQMMFDSIMLESLEQNAPQMPPQRFRLNRKSSRRGRLPSIMAAFPFPNTSNGWRSCWTSPRSRRSAPRRANP